MNKKNNLTVTIAFTLSFFFFFSCQSDESTVEEILEEEVEIISKSKNQTYYQIPSPDEMFDFIKQSGLSFNPELLSDIQNSNSYTTPKKQALNFGVYSADLAYAAAFKEFKYIAKYFGTVQDLADRIGILAAFDENLLKSVQGNLENADSLIEITNASYFAVVEYLEQNEQGDKLAIIASAGWIETLYVIANSINFSVDKQAVNRFADQKIVLENLLDYLKKYNENENVAEILLSFKSLELTFSNLGKGDSNGPGVTFKKKKSGKMVLGGGKSKPISEKQFNAVKEKVNEIRNNIVKIEL
jgi:hypothetical protein